MARRILAHLTLIAAALAAALSSMGTSSTPGQWMAGDFHQHSYFTDGGNTIPEVLENGVKYGLDWAANSEHGGTSRRDGAGKFWDDKALYPTDPIKGDRKEIERKTGEGADEKTDSYRVMWRWQSLIEFAYPLIQKVRGENPKNLFATGLEWNVPGHEHCSVGIVAEDAVPIGEFEYRFDRGDDDTSGGPGGGWKGKQYNQSEHAKAVEATKWMQQNHPDNGWIVFAHPERASSYTIADFRDFNDAGPTVAFGFEGLPGHQKNESRGGYREGRAVGDGTYGGAGYYIASVGGLWDALLGEGRNWWTFVSSDFHSINGDFWPGQYAKTWTFVPDNDGSGSFSLEEVAAGLRSGATFCAHGDLIDGLDVRAESGDDFVGMGRTLEVKKGRPVEVKIRFRTPEKNAVGRSPKVRAVQLISGEVGERAPKYLADGKTPNPAYADDRNNTAKVAALYLEKDLKRLDDGWWETPAFRIKKLRKDMYFRVRGTNLPPSTPRETDARGNPLPDSLAAAVEGYDSVQAALNDLWFYSNPVFVRVR